MESRKIHIVFGKKTKIGEFIDSIPEAIKVKVNLTYLGEPEKEVDEIDITIKGRAADIENFVQALKEKNCTIDGIQWLALSNETVAKIEEVIVALKEKEPSLLKELKGQCDGGYYHTALLGGSIDRHFISNRGVDIAQKIRQSRIDVQTLTDVLKREKSLCGISKALQQLLEM